MKRALINQQRTVTQHNRCLRDPHSHRSEGGGAGPPERQWKEVGGLLSLLSGSDLGCGTSHGGWPVTLRREGGRAALHRNVRAPELPPSAQECSTLRRISHPEGRPHQAEQPRRADNEGRVGAPQDCAHERKHPSPTWHSSLVGRPEQGTPARVPAHSCVKQQRPAGKCRQALSAELPKDRLSCQGL